jgi:hypothetical protein
VLGGRYAVRRRLAQLPRSERWSAHDTTLEREVVVVCFPADDPNADAALDAARRAAGIDNDRLVRILDVGRSDDLGYFVEEALHEPHTLTHLLDQGGLPSEEARRIAGEVATGLEAARARGLHHLRLTPSYVLRTGDGAVKLSGLATAAALAGVDDLEGTAAARVDAVGVVALTYAALTSRWPLPERVLGLEQAPQVVGGVAAPSEIAAGVPGDLDAICRLTLGEDAGPLTPGDFAAQVAPWSSTQISGLGGTAAPAAGAGLSVTDATLALPLPAPTATTAFPDTSSTGAVGAVAGSGGGSGVEESTVRLPGPGVTQRTPAAGGGAASGAAASGRAPASVASTAPARGSGTATPEPGTAAPGPAGPSTAEQAAASASAVAGAVGSALGTAGHAAGHAAGAAAGRVGSFARAAADKAADKAAVRRATRAEEHARARDARISLDDALGSGYEDEEPPLPMLPPETAQAPTRDQSKLVLGIIAGFLALVTVLAYIGVSQIGSGTGIDLSGTRPRPTVTVTGAPTTVDPAPSTTAEPEQPTGEPLAVLRATGFDPEGDGSERNGEAARVYDGDTSSYWSSEGYASADLGGLKKGVGVLLDLGQPAKLTQVQLTLPDASDLTVYLSDDRDLDGATKIASSKDRKGALTLPSGDKDASGQYVIVWFTKVSQVDDGRFRATLAEVALR